MSSAPVSEEMAIEVIPPPPYPPPLPFQQQRYASSTPSFTGQSIDTVLRYKKILARY